MRMRGSQKSDRKVFECCRVTEAGVNSTAQILFLTLRERERSGFSKEKEHCLNSWRRPWQQARWKRDRKKEKGEKEAKCNHRAV